MNILSIETSWDRGGIALFTGDASHAEIRFQREREHGKHLAPGVLKILRENDLNPRDLDLLCVDRGPGSYTGLRVGISFAKTFARALNLPLVSVRSPEAIAFGCPPPENLEVRTLCTVIDARWNEVYGAIYEAEENSWKQTGDLFTTNPDELGSKLPSSCLITGNGIAAHRKQFENTGWDLLSERYWYPKAISIGHLGKIKFEKTGESEDLYSLQPLYMRPSQAEV